MALPAQADVAVSDNILQKGLFSPPKCGGASDCLCEADIRYPQISGMKDTKQQEAINAGIKKSAEQLKCEGTPAKTASKGDNFSVSHGYEITYQSPDVIGFKFTDWAYEGGAHGNGAVEGMIIDTATGKILSIDDIFGAKNIPAVNKVVYDTLAPKSDGIFRDEIESRKGNFIRDDKCNGCTLVMDKSGMDVIFQTYEVAPFADGNPSVPVPASLIAYPALSKTLSASRSAGSP